MSTTVNFSVEKDLRADDLLVHDALRVNDIQPISPNFLVRFGGVTIGSQASVSAIGTSVNETLTIAQLLTSILTSAPTAQASWLPPTPALAVAGMASAQVGDSVDFSIINTSGVATNFITVTAVAGVTLVGQMVIQANDTSASRSEGAFRLVLNNVTAGAEAYTIYRLA